MNNNGLAMAGYSQFMVHLSHFAVHNDTILIIEPAWFIVPVDVVSQGIGGYMSATFASAAASLDCSIDGCCVDGCCINGCFFRIGTIVAAVQHVHSLTRPWPCI
jgi:hypothetical protein